MKTHLYTTLPDVAAILVLGVLCALGKIEPDTCGTLILAVLAGRLYPKTFGHPPSDSTHDASSTNATARKSSDHNIHRQPLPCGVLSILLLVPYLCMDLWHSLARKPPSPKEAPASEATGAGIEPPHARRTMPSMGGN